MNKFLILFVMLLLLSTKSFSQQINVEDWASIKQKKPFKINGGLSANGSHFFSNEMGARKPFTYQLNGNVNFSFFELINIPISINLNNYSSNFSYPTLPNRFSMHPSYKWISLHIGDISMSFSPNTLSGHLFTGAGVSLKFEKWDISLAGGRFLKKVDFDPINNIMPSYNRYGYGAKVQYRGSGFLLGADFFAAKDYDKTYNIQADSLGIKPKSNLAINLEGGLSLVKNLNISAQYAISFLTRDIRSPYKDINVLDKMFFLRESSSIYHAFKSSISYTFLKNNLGLNYERISPQYESLGAYYFNNDYENITLSYARPFLKDLINLSVNTGVQRNDLDGKKMEKTWRFVGSANLSYNPNEKIATSISINTFQSYRNIKSEFDFENSTTPYDNLDTLNFTQLSQTIDLNISYNTVKNSEQSQNLIFFASFQQAADKQGDYILPGNLNTFFNSSTSYSFEFIPQNLSISTSLSVSNNYAERKNTITFGPSLATNLKLIKKTLSTSFSISYNQTNEKNIIIGQVLNTRINISYRFLKKHSLSANSNFQYRKLTLKNVHSLTSMLNYSYSF